MLITTTLKLPMLNRKKVHAVMTNPNLLCLILCFRRMRKSRPARLQRRTPGNQHLKLIIRRYRRPITATILHRNRRKTNKRGSSSFPTKGRPCHSTRTCKETCRSNRQATRKNLTTTNRRLQHLIKRRVIRRISNLLIVLHKPTSKST